jgi:hypothetical protein
MGHVQALATQVCMAPQAFSQLPQCAWSVVVSTQAPPHALPPFGQAHWPAWQLVPLGHWVVQLPQWFGSVCVSTHEAPQAACGAVHVAPAPAPPTAVVMPPCPAIAADPPAPERPAAGTLFIAAGFTPVSSPGGLEPQPSNESRAKQSAPRACPLMAPNRVQPLSVKRPILSFLVSVEAAGLRGTRAF